MLSSKRGEHKYFLYDNRARIFHEIRDGTLCGRLEGEHRYPKDGLLSRKHCRFSIDGNEVYVEDVGSTNSTRVNTVPIVSGKKRRIRLNDVIEIGNQRLILTNQNRFAPANTEDCPKGVSGIIAVQKDDGSVTRFTPKEITRTLTKRTLLLLDPGRFRQLRQRREQIKMEKPALAKQKVAEEKPRPRVLAGFMLSLLFSLGIVGSYLVWDPTALPWIKTEVSGLIRDSSQRFAEIEIFRKGLLESPQGEKRNADRRSANDKRTVD